MDYGDRVRLTFATGGNSALCGIVLEVGEEYLLDLVRHEWDDDSLWSAGLCGGTRSWSAVTDQDLVFLNDISNCDLDDKCLAEPCGEFQVLYNNTWVLILFLGIIPRNTRYSTNKEGFNAKRIRGALGLKCSRALQHETFFALHPFDVCLISVAVCMKSRERARGKQLRRRLDLFELPYLCSGEPNTHIMVQEIET